MLASDPIRLSKPTTKLKEAYLAFYREWLASGETMVPWVIGKDPSDFDAMVQSLLSQEQGDALPPGWVPDSTYWLVHDDGTILGAVNIRHQLTDKLLQSGGHIGYGIRPSARGRGYAVRQLALALEEARGLGIERALVVCDAWNAASERAILRCGGIADADFVEEDGNIIKRYWIPLDQRDCNGKK